MIITKIRQLSVIATLAGLLASNAIAGHFHGRSIYDQDYSEKSLFGEYVMVAEGKGGSGPEAVFGVVTFDGHGGVAGSVVINTGLDAQPRSIAEVDISGQYSVEAIGEGSLGFDAGFSSAIYVVRDSSIFRGRKIATEIAFVADGLTASGNVLKGYLKRRMRHRDFSESSVAGNYGLINEGFGGQGQGISVGVVTWEEDSNYIFGDFTGSFPGASADERSIIKFFSGGPYSINADGSGITLSDTTGGQSHYLITETEWYRGKLLAKEIYFAVEFLDPFGNWSPATMNRISR